ncbi:cell cycle control protein 50B-like [Bufo bufo]|uniref:cell cycle control protein 50B-like n=1 Tax=Bufo bufo TaxID=8384 RepID=UPI001ABE93E9|nr:cell cycle control protein 50B-like [Bufo bufo]
MKPPSRNFANKHEPLPSQRPDNTAFTQQRIPAWQPLLSASIILPFFFFIGLSFIGIGIGLNYSSNSIKESEHDYTGALDGEACFNCTSANASRPCICNIPFNITEDFQGAVFMYYELSNFYQNHYRYMISRDEKQLNGDLSSLTNPANECAPYRVNAEQKPIAPCGAIANSMFNDVVTLYYNQNGTYVEVPLDGKGISWWTDYNIKFRNPTNGTESLAQIFNATVKPDRWLTTAYDLSSDLNNTGFINEDFIVWMRSAALPTFRKLYRRIENGNFKNGEYQLRIVYNFPVVSFQGRKKIVFSSVSWMGGKNPFLGIAYLVFGSLCIVFAIIMLVVFIKYQGKMDDDI